jgi:carbamoyl-phosphate synthase large subunit
MNSTIGVTGMNAGDSPAPGVPVIRSLKEHPGWRGKIIGLAYEALESGVLDSTMVEAAYLLPYPKSGKEALFERIQHIHGHHRLDAIIPNLDSEMLNFIRIRERLSELGIRLFLPAEEQFTRRSKVNLEKLGQEAGVKVPKTAYITGPDRIDIKKEELPVLVKGLFYEAYRADTPLDAARYVRKVAATWGYPVIVQRFTEGDEFNAAALCRQGETLSVVCMKKLVLTDKGKGWACVSIRNEDLVDLTVSLAKALSWSGALEVEAIYSKQDKAFYLIEVNPRFPAWIYLATAAGINLPYMYYQLTMGERVAQAFDYKTGVVFTNYTTNLITDISRIDTLFTAGEIEYEKTL